MFNEAKPIYIKHLTPPLFLIHQIFIFSSDIYRSSEIKSYRYESILSIRINLIAKNQSYIKNISSNMIFIYLLRLYSYNKIV